MRSKWEEVHASLVSSVTGLRIEEEFAEVAARCPPLRRFSEPLALVGYLTSKEGDRDEKDRIVWALIGEARRGPSARLAQSLLILGFWRPLDVIRDRRARFFRGEGDLELELLETFTLQWERLRPDRVRRVAATLVRNTERDFVAQRLRDFERLNRAAEVTPEIAAVPAMERHDSVFGIDPTDSDAEAIKLLGRWLAKTVGRDAPLVVDVVVRGRAREAVAARLGIPRKTLNKRLERALARARRALEVDSVSPRPFALALVWT
jgi:hypothetical protein